MAKKALIFENRLVDVVDTEFEVAETMTWMDCPDECKAGKWELVDGTLQVIPEPEDTRTYAKKREAEYPSFYDYLDGVVKSDQTQIDKYIADAQDVKARHPKGG